jgi:hypothetical protein
VGDLEAFREAAFRWVVGRAADAGQHARDLAPSIRRVILVEGVSDAAAVEALASVSGLNLVGAGVCVIPMGGVTNVAKFAAALGPAGLGMRLAGLCDAGEEHHVRHGLERAGIGRPQTRDELAELGFFVCVEDLEDELIRILGTDRVEDILDQQGDLRAFRTFQNQPSKRGAAIDSQLHRFLGTTSGRKERYGRILAEALRPPSVPAPLADLLRFVG